MEGHDTEATGQNSENIRRTDKFAAAQMKFDSAVKEEAFILPPMAASDLEKNKKTLVSDLDDKPIPRLKKIQFETNAATMPFNKTLGGINTDGNY